MQIEWYGQSAFRLSAAEGTVAIDPFGDLSALTDRGITWDYPEIVGLEAQLLLVTHEHVDHNAVEVVGGDPVTIRSTAGRLESPFGDVVSIASEHDEVAGTERGPNSIVVFSFDGVRACHFGDFGQAALRPEQRAAIGDVDLLFLPVGGGPTIGAEQASTLVSVLSPRWVVPMHYRTEKISFLETAEDFLERSARVQRLSASTFELSELEDGDGPLVVVPAAP
jgi:L-ascorbate metabolism protein UlaG (beta-lactamase superfamily)